MNKIYDTYLIGIMTMALVICLFIVKTGPTQSIQLQLTVKGAVSKCVNGFTFETVHGDQFNVVDEQGKAIPCTVK